MVSTLLCKYGSSTLSKASIQGVVALLGDCKDIPANKFAGISLDHGCVKSTVIQRRQHQLDRMADFSPLVTFSVFDL